MSATDRGLEVDLPPLKARAIDPLVLVGDESVRYSQLEPSYKAYLAGQWATMAKGYKATILMRPDVAARIVNTSDGVGLRWEQAIKRERSATALARKVLGGQLRGPQRHFDLIIQA